MSQGRLLTIGLVWGLALASSLPGALPPAALGSDKATPAAFELKTSQACLLVDREGRVAIKPKDAACPAPAPFRSPLWVITLAEGTNAFQPGPKVATSQAAAPQVSPAPGGVRIVCDGIRYGDKTFGIRLDLSITVADDEFRFGGTIVNKTKERIVTEWKYPILLGIAGKREAGSPVTPAVFWPDGLGRRFLTPESFGPRRTFGYPGGRGTMQWLAFTHGATGLYFGCHDPKCSSKTFAVARSSAGNAGYDVSLQHQPYCVPGERWEGPATVAMPFAGSWHVAATRYRRWVDSWLDPLPKPKWAQDSTGWFLAILKQQNGDRMWDYRSLDRLTDLAEQRGLDTLGLFGWAQGGHDRSYPDYIPDPAMGGPEVLKESIRKVRERGKHVILYANGQLIDSATEFYRLQGVESIVSDRKGNPVTQMYHKFKATSTPIFVTACTAAPVWRHRMLQLAQQAHALGANGILFDQLGVMEPFDCFTESHGHKTPATSFAEGRLDLIRGIARQMRKLDPEFIIMTEGVIDFELADIPYFHGCGTGFGYSEPGPSETAFPELFRYTYPTFTATQRIPNPFLTRNYANFACVYGLRFEIESRYPADVRYLTTDRIPAPSEYSDCNSPPDVALLQTVPCKESAEYMRQVAALREKHVDLLLRGRFVDVEGVAVEGAGVVGKAFQADDRIGVVLWNPTGEPRPAKVTVAGHAFSAAYAPGAAGVVDCDAPIAPESIRLVVWKKQ